MTQKDQLPNNIAFDIDDVTIDFINPMKKIASEKFNVSIDQLNTSGYYIEIPGVEEETVAQWIKHDDTLISSTLDMNLKNDAKEILIQFYNDIQEPIKFITARPDTHTKVLYELFEKQFQNKIECDIICCGRSSLKVNYMTGLDYFVDDKKQTIHKIHHLLKTVFLYKCEWSSDPSGLPENCVMINNLEEVYNFWKKDVERHKFIRTNV